MPNAYFVSDIHKTSPEKTRDCLPASLIARIGDRASAFRSANLGSWLDAPCYFKLVGNDRRFYELTEENLRQPGAQTLERLSAVK